MFGIDIHAIEWPNDHLGGRLYRGNGEQYIRIDGGSVDCYGDHCHTERYHEYYQLRLSIYGWKPQYHLHLFMGERRN